VYLEVAGGALCGQGVGARDGATGLGAALLAAALPHTAAAERHHGGEDAGSQADAHPRGHDF